MNKNTNPDLQTQTNEPKMQSVSLRPGVFIINYIIWRVLSITEF